MIMRKFFNLFLILVILTIPGSNGCINTAYVNNIVETDCRSFQYPIKIEGTPNISMFPSNCKDFLFEPKVVSEVFFLFVQEYSKKFEVSEQYVWLRLQDLKIELSIIPRTVEAAYDNNGNYLKGEVPVTGLALSPYHVWVEVKTSQVWSSSLVHELVHIIIWRENLNIHGDPDHEGNQFSGWEKKHTELIEDLRLTLMDLNL